MIRRHAPYAVQGRIKINQLIRVARQHPAHVIGAGQSDDAGEQIRPAKQRVGGMGSPQAASQGHQPALPGAVAVDKGHKLLCDMAEPCLVQLHALPGRAVCRRPGLLIQAVHTVKPQPAPVDPGAADIHHAKPRKITAFAVLRGIHQAGQPIVPIHVHAKAPVEDMAVKIALTHHHGRRSHA